MFRFSNQIMKKIDNISKVITETLGEDGTIYLYGYIGQEAIEREDAKKNLTDIDILQAIKELEGKGCKRCHVRINSPGGSMLDGDAIVTLLKETKMEVFTYCDGMAASMAADIWMVAKKENRNMAKNGKLMIHAPHSGIRGNAIQLRKEAERLEKYETAAIAQMSHDTGMKEADIRQKFYDGNDHWLTSVDAVELGLIVEKGNYEAENIPASPEKMTHEDIVAYYEQIEKVELGLFKRFKTWLFSEKEPDKVSEPTIISQENTEEMTIDEIVQACGSGGLNKIDLLEKLGAKMFPKAKPEETEEEEGKPEKGLTEADVQKLIERATTPLQTIINDQTAKIEKMGNLPGAAPTGVVTKGDVTIEDKPLSEADKAINAHNKSIMDAIRKGDSIKIA